MPLTAKRMATDFYTVLYIVCERWQLTRVAKGMRHEILFAVILK